MRRTRVARPPFELSMKPPNRVRRMVTSIPFSYRPRPASSSVQICPFSRWKTNSPRGRCSMRAMRLLTESTLSGGSREVPDRRGRSAPTRSSTSASRSAGVGGRDATEASASPSTVERARRSKQSRRRSALGTSRQCCNCWRNASSARASGAWRAAARAQMTNNRRCQANPIASFSSRSADPIRNGGGRSRPQSVRCLKCRQIRAASYSERTR